MVVAVSLIRDLKEDLSVLMLCAPVFTSAAIFVSDFEYFRVLSVLS